MDESGFMLQPVVRRTWAPQGQTPVQYSWDRHDRLSAISALTASPVRRRLGLYFRLQEENFRGEAAAEFLVQVRRALGRPLLVVWDRWSVHRKAARLLAPRLGEGIDFEWLPPYAPELNPTEQVWTHTKYADLANFIPEDVGHLRLEVAASITDQRSTPSLLRSFFAHAKFGL